MCKIGKSDAEMLQALQTACADNSLKRQLCITGKQASEVGKECSEMSFTVGDLPLL